MTPFAVKAIQLLLSLSILIVLHELGHFIPAKIFKTRVEKFFLFFDVKFALFKKKIGETVYGIGWLPLGGYVKISGMIDESMDTEQMAQPPQPWEFRSKPTWQRLIIMLGGVTVNILVGLFIYMGILFFYGENIVTQDDLPHGFAVAGQLKDLGFQDGDQVQKVNGKPLEDVMKVNSLVMLRNVKNIEVRHPDGQVETLSLPETIGMDLFQAGEMIPFQARQFMVIDSVLQGLPADKAGLQKGDKILTVNGADARFFDQYKKLMARDSSAEKVMVFERNGKVDTLTVLPDDGIIGVYNFGKIEPTHVSYSLAASIPAGAAYGYNTLVNYAKQFKYVFTKKGATQVGGFGAIGNLFPDTWNWPVFWEMTALISIILAFMNILPIPALDGGHVMFLLYEMITGRKPNDKVMEYAQMIGFFILIALVLFANGNDIYRWLFK